MHLRIVMIVFTSWPLHCKAWTLVSQQDRLIAIPVEYLNTTNLFGVTDDATFRATCNVISNGVEWVICSVEMVFL